MRRRPRPLSVLVVRVLALVVPLAGLATCNVFTSLQRCDDDGDCGEGARCDVRGRYCVRPEPDAGDGLDAGPDVGADAQDGAVDGAADAPCDLRAPFEDITLVPGLGSDQIFSARFTPDENVALIATGTASNTDLYLATKDGGGYEITRAIASLNTSFNEYWPTMSADGKVLFFESNRSLEKVGGVHLREHARIWTSTRVNLISEFEEPRIQSIFAGGPDTQEEASPYLHPHGHALYFVSFERPGKGSGDIFVAELDPENGLATAVKNVEGINTPLEELAPVVSFDDRMLFFGRQMKTASTERSILLATRATPTEAFEAAEVVAELETEYDEFPSWVSADACRLYFFSNRPAPADAGPAAQYRLWSARRPAVR